MEKNKVLLEYLELQREFIKNNDRYPTKSNNKIPQYNYSQSDRYKLFEKLNQGIKEYQTVQ